MSDTYADQIGEYYQVEEDAAPAGLQEVEAALIDYATGAPLLDENNGEPLVASDFQSVVSASGSSIVPVVVNDKRVVQIDVTNREQSEVEVTLLGVPRSETALNLLGAVNIYGINSKEWSSGPFGAQRYTYFLDPESWTFRDNYGTYLRHLPNESAIQAYAFPPPVSFAYPEDDGSGLFPGGYTDGQARVFWETKRTFRYQPGRVTGFTFGVRMSTGSDYEGEEIQWGCRNDYGDGYYFQLERGANLFIIHRYYNAVSNAVEETKIARSDWNGDQVSLEQSETGWVLDLSKVTMFKIEFSWYGAVGAKFYAYVPVDHNEARWVKLHYVIVENSLEYPSLRSAFMKMFLQARTTAGTSSAAFINLYGSSVYIDGGDKGTVTLGSAGLESAKPIDSTSRAVLGLQVKGFINNVDSQKTVYPVGLSVFADVPTRLDLVLQENGIRAGESYFYGQGTRLQKASSSAIPVTRINATTLSGSFPDLSAELSGPTNYSSGRRVRVNGTSIFNTHVVSATSTQITTDRPLPDTVPSITLSRFNGFAVASGVIPSGATTASVYFTPSTGSFRIGIWPQSSGQAYTTSAAVYWIATRYTALNFSANGAVIGERALPGQPYREATITVATGTTDTVLSFSSVEGNPRHLVSGVVLSGVTNPWPMSLVVEMLDGALLDDVVVALGTKEERLITGSGSATAISQWSTVNGLTADATAAGGTSYVANKFEQSASDPLSAVLVDRQGYRVLRSPQPVATFFVGQNENKQIDLSNMFGPDKMFIAGKPGTAFNSGALFAVATARAGSGTVNVTLNWEEQ